MQDLCNCGYARGRCDQFPAASAADAVRFSVVTGDAAAVRLVYILEKNHAPVEHGTINFAIRESEFIERPPNVILGAQARAFLESHLARRARAAAG